MLTPWSTSIFAEALGFTRVAWGMKSPRAGPLRGVPPEQVHLLHCLLTNHHGHLLAKHIVHPFPTCHLFNFLVVHHITRLSNAAHEPSPRSRYRTQDSRFGCSSRREATLNGKSGTGLSRDFLVLRQIRLECVVPRIRSFLGSTARCQGSITSTHFRAIMRPAVLARSLVPRVHWRARGWRLKARWL